MSVCLFLGLKTLFLEVCVISIPPWNWGHLIISIRFRNGFCGALSDLSYNLPIELQRFTIWYTSNLISDLCELIPVGFVHYPSRDLVLWYIFSTGQIWNFYLKINFKIQTCLFTIARFSASESLRVYPNIYKNSPPFASREGFPLVGIAMSVRERESASDSIIINTIYKRIRGEEGGTCE